MKSRATWAAGFFAALSLALGIAWNEERSRPSPAPSPTVDSDASAQIDGLLKLGDQDLLKRAQEIAQLEGLQGRMMTALLACVGFRVQAQQVAPATPLPSPSAPPLAQAEPMPSPTAHLAPLPSGPDRNGFFCHEVKGTPNWVDPAKWADISPLNAGAVGAMDREFGIFSIPAGDESAFLDERATSAPALWTLTEKQKSNGGFFKRLHGKVFEGHLELLAAANHANLSNLSLHLHFNPVADDPNREYWVVYQGSGRRPEDVYENRYTTTAVAQEVWRYNATTRSVSLLGDHCSWNDDSDYEYKDLFYLTGSNEVVGNVFCRKRKDKSWVRVGKFTLQARGS